ncbi:hypothetical protein BDZ85DRAFT_315757 [Elsinoe ampelina]|uniref:RNA-binding S4 domain-containing protein n=1 Tax=Elsinoe ampelina TaxID=302913 RepID=A0A6A6GRA7_9PEZI|nr:hypothetical protein BDZ85DRAFT_315757 [Elsinoe ampelina]
MTRKRFHNLKRPKVRQDWSKWTLFNLSRLREPRHDFKTFFQQKWEAKSLTRAFHGNQIREKKWQLMFDRRLPAVVPVDAAVLARTDGRHQSGGRGSGKDVAEEDLEEDGEDGEDAQKVAHKPDERLGQRTPYMQMAYWPTERRLDTAVWRALFASSALQARQFVVHGAVRVNGKKMRHPGYLLNPGDMFQVEPERVLYATGARKFDKNSPETSQGRDMSGEEGKSSRQRNDERELDEDDELEEELETEETEETEVGLDEGESLELAEAEIPADPKKALRHLLSEAREILANPKEKAKMSGKQKQAMRAFSRQVKSTMSKIRGDTVAGAPAGETVEDLQATLEKLLRGEASTTTSASETSEDKMEEQTGKEDEEGGRIYAHRDARLLRQALDLASENESEMGSINASKPYATPWQPREFMSAFAFIPRYLEVNHKICSAVYLRHPVARPGLAEVPSPYNEEVYELAHNWYLRRR